MPSAFILEDDLSRIAVFTSRLKGWTLTICNTVTRAENMFDPPYSIIFLDHDLADEHYSNANMEKGTGTEFARWLAKTYAPTGGPIVIHSYNRDGALRMKNALQPAGWRVVLRPFGPVMLRDVLEG